MSRDRHRVLRLSLMSAGIGLALWGLMSMPEATPERARTASALGGKRASILGATASKDSSAPGDSAAALETADAAQRFDDKWLSNESIEMNRLQKNPKEISSKLSTLAGALTIEERTRLVRVALQASRSKNERFLALTLLTLSPHATAADLLEVAVADSPYFRPRSAPAHSVGEIKRTFEVALRLKAIEALETRALRDPSYLKDLEIASVQAPVEKLRTAAFRAEWHARRGHGYLTAQLVRTKWTGDKQ